PLLPTGRDATRRGRSVAVVLPAVLDAALRRPRPGTRGEVSPIGRAEGLGGGAEAPPYISEEAGEAMKIVITSLMVDDQAKALAFYTEKLGFQKEKDIPLGAFRW